MGHTYTRLLVHIVFSTKARRPQLTKAIQSRAFAYMAGIAKSTGAAPVAVGGMADHVHMLMLIPAKESVSALIRAIKANSSRWLRNELHQQTFAWQTGYSAFSVSESACESVAEYIQNQEAHHRKRTFQDELRLLLRKHGIEYDERFLWD
ncbi:MAG: IS200/IS605 family transposase [Candidatus Zixiibacteriota bacterium]